MQFVQLASGVDTVPVLLELARAARLWDRNPERRLYPGTPHGEMVDITVRYMPQDQVTLEARGLEHRNVFWPAWHELPALRPLVFGLMQRVAATELGSILITKLPTGGIIKPHSDAGSWAPEYYNCKCHITLEGSALVRCGEDMVEMKAGTIWTFDNLLDHSVECVGENDRVNCIISMRCD